jgi:hypothetical protein
MITGLDVAVDTGLAVAFAFAVAVGDEFCVCVWVWFCVCVLGVGVGVGVGVLLAKAPTGSIKPTQTETVAICKRVFFMFYSPKVNEQETKAKGENAISDNTLTDSKQKVKWSIFLPKSLS